MSKPQGNKKGMLLMLNKKLLQKIDKDFLGLANGKMGVCIYLYHLSRIEKEPEYEKMAEDLLNEILEKISVKMPINVEVGLAGIAIGVDHLLKEHFIDGNIEEILEEIDDAIFKSTAFDCDNFSDIYPPELMHILYYFYIRYMEQKDEDKKYIFSRLIIKIVEVVYNKLTINFFSEPLSFSFNYHLPRFLFVISKIISLDIYNKRIYHILDEYKHKILGSFPVSHGNRLFLLWGIANLYLHYNTKELLNQINLLKKNIDLSLILNQELSNKRIFMSNGVSLIYFLLLHLQNIPQVAIKFDSHMLSKRLLSSKIWDQLLNEEYHYGFLNGIPAPILAISLIKHNA